MKNLTAMLAWGMIVMALTVIQSLAQSAYEPYIFTTLAGNPGPGSADGTGSAARFNQPIGVAVDTAGNVYVADTFNHTIRKVTSAGVVTTLAGRAGEFGSLVGVAVDSAGNVYVADTGNNTIRKGNPSLIILKSGFDGPKFTLNLTGQIGRSVALEASTDLVNWLPLGTASFLIGQMTKTDPNASHFTRRFYRVNYLPILRGE